jgi:hypothetical protein
MGNLPNKEKLSRVPRETKGFINQINNDLVKIIIIIMFPEETCALYQSDGQQRISAGISLKCD